MTGLDAMTDTQVHNIFPTPLWVVDFAPEIYRPLNHRLKTVLYDMMGARPQAGRVGTMQTDNDLQTYDEFTDIVALAGQAVQAAIAHLQVECENFEFTGFWANINPPGEAATPHAHPNNFLGGVYYVQTDPGADSIYFTDPRPQAGVISPPVMEDSIYSGNEVSVPARPGRMVVFPAWLVHGVPANRSTRDRISMSFNVMFPHFTENMSRPKWQPSLQLKRAAG